MLCRQLEEFGAAGSLERATELIEELDKAFAETATALESEVAGVRL